MLTEIELKQTFATRVYLPVGNINYRILEESMKGIEAEMKKEIFPHKKRQLLNVRNSIRIILSEL